MGVISAIQHVNDGIAFYVFSASKYFIKHIGCSVNEFDIVVANANRVIEGVNYDEYVTPVTSVSGKVQRKTFDAPSLSLVELLGKTKKQLADSQNAYGDSDSSSNHSQNPTMIHDKAVDGEDSDDENHDGDNEGKRADDEDNAGKDSDDEEPAESSKRKRTSKPSKSNKKRYFF